MGRVKYNCGHIIELNVLIDKAPDQCPICKPVCPNW